jgi:hypothetical protein
MLKISFMKLNARYDTSLPFIDVGVIADILAGMHNAIVKYLFVVRRCIHKGLHS